MYYVIFRACDRVTAVNGLGRPGGLHKTALIKACFTSLIRSLHSFPHKIIVLGDKLSDELIAFFQTTNVELILGSYGNDESIRQTLALGLQAPAGSWVYFCEDDYLHHPSAFGMIDELIRKRGFYLSRSTRNLFELISTSNTKHLVIFPPDYPDRYLAERREPSRLYITNNCHWRQVKNITFTFMTHVDTLKKYAWAIRHCATGAKDGRLSRLMFRRILPGQSAICLSPIPGLTTHMHEGVMSPLVNWTGILSESLNAASHEAELYREPR